MPLKSSLQSMRLQPRAFCIGRRGAPHGKAGQNGRPRFHRPWKNSFQTGFVSGLDFPGSPATGLRRWGGLSRADKAHRTIRASAPAGTHQRFRSNAGGFSAACSTPAQTPPQKYEILTPHPRREQGPFRPEKTTEGAGAFMPLKASLQSTWLQPRALLHRLSRTTPQQNAPVRLSRGFIPCTNPSTKI
jgi:hypothetical protein